MLMIYRNRYVNGETNVNFNLTFVEMLSTIIVSIAKIKQIIKIENMIEKSQWIKIIIDIQIKITGSIKSKNSSKKTLGNFHQLKVIL